MNRAGTRSGWSWLLVPVLFLLCSACADPIGGRAAAPPVPVLSAEQAVRQSLVGLGEAGVLHYQGTLVNPDGKQVGLDVSVTATGEAGGTITVGAQHGALVVVSGALYVDAPAQFWSLLSGDPGSAADAVNSRWVKVPSVAVGIDIGATLRPDAFAGRLAGLAGDAGDGPFTQQPVTTVRGTRAVEVGVGHGAVDLAAAASHGVLHVTMPTGLGNARNVSLDVADVSSAEAGVYQNLHQQAGQLSAAVDTSVNIKQGGQRWGTCTAAACSVVVTFTNASAVATKVVVAGNWTGDGTSAGTCRVVIGPVAAGHTGTAACTDGSAAWVAFFGHAHSTPGQHPYSVDWTAEALAAPPNVGALADEATAAGKPATVDGGRSGPAYVYVIDYQDSGGHPKVWKYGVTTDHGWQADATAQLTACRSVSHTSCTAALVTSAPDRPSADALMATLVAKATGGTGCPPGQWVDCTTPPSG
jgi:hypothetical protein